MKFNKNYAHACTLLPGTSDGDHPYYSNDGTKMWWSGENIHSGIDLTPYSVMYRSPDQGYGWTNHYPHDVNIIDMRHGGVGHGVCDEYWSQDFNFPY